MIPSILIAGILVVVASLVQRILYEDVEEHAMTHGMQQSGIPGLKHKVTSLLVINMISWVVISMTLFVTVLVITA